jgi:hypothetical protein
MSVSIFLPRNRKTGPCRAVCQLTRPSRTRHAGQLAASP